MNELILDRNILNLPRMIEVRVFIHDVDTGLRSSPSSPNCLSDRQRFCQFLSLFLCHCKEVGSFEPVAGHIPELFRVQCKDIAAGRCHSIQCVRTVCPFVASFPREEIAQERHVEQSCLPQLDQQGVCRRLVHTEESRFLQ